MSGLLTLLWAAQQPAPKTGLYHEELNGMPVKIWAPERPPNQRVLAFLFLCHGYNGTENNAYIAGTLESMKKLGVADQFVLMSGKSKAPGWTEEDDETVLKNIDWAKKNYPIDPRRTYLFGSSNGAHFVGRFGWTHQDVQAAIVGYCGTYNFSKQVTQNMALQWFLVHGSKDNPENSKRTHEDLLKKGYRSNYRELKDYGHTDIWDGIGHTDNKHIEVREEWIRWLTAMAPKAPAANAQQDNGGRTSPFSFKNAGNDSTPSPSNGAESSLSAKEKEFMALHRSLQPPKDELWRTIPWKISLLEARDMAAKLKKPIFLWSMDGNPLAAG